MPYFLYILHDQTLDKFYIGQTGNLYDRLVRHFHHRSKYTKTGNYHLAYVETYKARSEATIREKYLKSLKSKIAIKKLVEHSDN